MPLGEIILPPLCFFLPCLLYLCVDKAKDYVAYMDGNSLPRVKNDRR